MHICCLVLELFCCLLEWDELFLFFWGGGVGSDIWRCHGVWSDLIPNEKVSLIGHFPIKKSDLVIYSFCILSVSSDALLHCLCYFSVSAKVFSHICVSWYTNFHLKIFSYQATLKQLFQEFADSGQTSSELATVTMQIMQALQSNLDGKSKNYRDPALTHLFLMNNIHYIVRSVRRYAL